MCESPVKQDSTICPFLWLRHFLDLEVLAYLVYYFVDTVFSVVVDLACSTTRSRVPDKDVITLFQHRAPNFVVITCFASLCWFFSHSLWWFHTLPAFHFSTCIAAGLRFQSLVLVERVNQQEAMGLSQTGDGWKPCDVTPCAVVWKDFGLFNPHIVFLFTTHLLSSWAKLTRSVMTAYKAGSLKWSPHFLVSPF